MEYFEKNFKKANQKETTMLNKRFIFTSLLLLTLSLSAKEKSWEKYKQITHVIQKKVPGWCCEEKVEKQMQLIYDIKPDIVVEVGVFGGSSVYPMARALKFNGKGKIYAIDPWANEECIIGYEKDDPNYKWWNEVNLDKVYRDFKLLIKKNRLDDFCVPMKMTGEEAMKTFEDESIDILHIDGTHTEEGAYLDAVLYLPKVKRGGYIWFDDVNWTTKRDGQIIYTTRKAQNYLLQYCVFDQDRSVKDECYLFQKL